MEIGGKEKMREALYILLPPILAISTYTEVRSRRIPNWLTLGGIVSALTVSFLIGSFPTFKVSFLGMLVGAGVFLPFCLAGVLGGGDFKLMGAVGAIVGFPVILWTLYYTVLAGGIIAVAYAIWTGRLFSTLSDLFGILVGRKRKNADGLRNVPTVPYGIAIAAGTLWSLAMMMAR